MKLIKISKGKEVIVDDDDFEELNKFKWHYNKLGYVARSGKENGKRFGVYMHRQIMNTPKGKYTDHINGNTLDNTKNNLRICTQAENSRNSRSKNNGYKGVIKRTNHNSYMAQIELQGKVFYLGNYKTAELAAKAYDKKAIELFGEFAKLNF